MKNFMLYIHRIGNRTRRLVWFILSLVFCFIILSSCGTRDLSTPSKRLVGHWATNYGDHLYYGPIDHRSQTGVYTTVFVGEVARHQYKIISEVPHGELVTVLVNFSHGTTHKETCAVSEDGTKLRKEIILKGIPIVTEPFYVDGKISP